ncbi:MULTISPECIES: hypothetical protein [unclassified Duganella]|uniref:hypothetical protein n=1 Tax=unclassified Duganella TaxID=2636909 RepID=UPI000E3503F6|nr:MULTISPECIES: hypothetical protein [unclassified Duganella]RFP15869.1 hypothetical protein D0T23_08145 [Duganella sp. BJB475]RFP32967.1 hypothetical protein D0T21_12485 [Duganella sp. BJB476]
MAQFKHLIIGAALAGAAFATQANTTTTPPQNLRLQQAEIARGDPPRWYQDDASPAEQLRTLRKEIGAALAEANLACKQGPAAERSACMKEARATYQHDMANAAQIRAENHPH